MSQDKDFQILILEKISEIGERSARMEVEQANMKSRLDNIDKHDIVQNGLLAEHIQGVQTQAARLDNEIKIREILEGRVVNLEIAPKFRATLKQYLMTVGGIASAMVGIFKLLKFLGL